jgi:hypothetical protein
LSAEDPVPTRRPGQLALCLAGWSGSCAFDAYGTYAFHTLRIAVTPDTGDAFKKTVRVVLREKP